MKRIQVKGHRGFRVIAGTKRSQAATMVIAPGGSEGGRENKHRGSDQWLWVLSGIGQAKIGKKNLKLRSGTLLLIEAGERHEIKNTGRRPLRTLNFYAPPEY